MHFLHVFVHINKQTNKKQSVFGFVSFHFISSTWKSVFTFLLISSAWGTAWAERAAHNNIIIEYFFLPLVLFSIQTYHSIVHTCLTHECIRIELIGFANQRRMRMGEGMRERIKKNPLPCSITIIYNNNSSCFLLYAN